MSVEWKLGSQIPFPTCCSQVTCPTSTSTNASERSILERSLQADSRFRDKKLGDLSPEKLHYHREHIYRIFQNACVNYICVPVKTIRYLGAHRKKEKRTTQPFLYRKTHQAASSLQAQSAVRHFTLTEPAQPRSSRSWEKPPHGRQRPRHTKRGTWTCMQSAEVKYF